MRRKGTIILSQQPNGRASSTKAMRNSKTAIDKPGRHHSITALLETETDADSFQKIKNELPKRLPMNRTRKIQENNICIQNCYASLLTLIDAVYPPSICPTCNVAFPNQMEADLHHRTLHQSQPRFPCMHPHCDLIFQSRGGLRFHISKCHIVERGSGRTPRNPILLQNGGPRQGHFSISSKARNTLSSRRESNCMLALETNHAPSNGIQSPEKSASPIQAYASENGSTDERMSYREPSHPRQTFSDGNQAVSNTNGYSRASPDSDTTVSAASSTLPHIKVLQWTANAPRRRKPSLSAASEVLLNAVYDPLRCPSCRASFPRKTNVIKHLVEFHQGEEPYRCVFQRCNHPKRYATREGLIYHILKSHDERQDDETESDDARTQTDTEDAENTVSDHSHGSSTETES